MVIEGEEKYYSHFYEGVRREKVISLTFHQFFISKNSHTQGLLWMDNIMKYYKHYDGGKKYYHLYQ